MFFGYFDPVNIKFDNEIIVFRGDFTDSLPEQETALIEAFNLKSAIEFRLKNIVAAREALNDMPPRQLEELDPVTLHNRALTHMDEDPEEGFNTLNFLINNPPFPPETFANLLLLYIKPPLSYHDLAADTIAEHPDYVQTYLTRDVIAFLDAANMKSNSPEAAYQQFEVLAKQHIERMRLLTKQIQASSRILRMRWPHVTFPLYSITSLSRTPVRRILDNPDKF